MTERRSIAGTLPRATIPPRVPIGADWLDQVFRAKAVMHGGVVRRRVADVEREVGRAALELEVRRRGFHMVEAGGHFVIFCSPDPLRLIV